MNPFDIIILVILILFALKGLVRGLVNEASSLAGLILGGWLAYRYYPSLAGPLGTLLHLPRHMASFLSFMLLLLVTGLVAHILGNIVTAALRLIMLGSLNRLGGLIIGAVEGALLLGMLFSIGTAEFMPLQVKQKIRTTESSAVFAQLGDRMIAAWRNNSGDRKP